MAEGSIASAVALPDPEPSSPDATLKRRQFPSQEDNNTKRRRVSTSQAQSTADDTSQVSPVVPRTSVDDGKEKGRQKTGREEERKRGQRLFGALLGTLSQSSLTATQKRRADIERKQQAKLKQQDEEYDEQYRKRREELMARRRRDQVVYERESLRVRHSNLRAMARSLKTKSTPTLYYKPWQLRPEEKDIIDSQVEDAEATIAKEVEDFERRNRRETEGSQPDKEAAELPPAVESRSTADPTESIANNGPKPDTVGSDTNDHQEASEAQKQTTTNDIPVPPDRNEETAHARPNEDDSGEVVLEDKEDTVIY
uniref:Pinin/SDK/MemA protein domain-containing protein n=1 Tax=Coccidioides posadasii RMSCC 3488 TaxID=454284 RepID=A0A0J6IJI0_COCPO|nr:hypothetical protein CPAG_08361 [Coccidioides posadasii RMSCC 3488]